MSDSNSSRGERDENRDLGFGSVVSTESRQRLLNRDGSFNVARRGLPFWRSFAAYHWLLTSSWRGFLAQVTASYLAANAIFAVAYHLCGAGALESVGAAARLGRAWQCFFFSVETFSTIGFGNITPAGLAPNLIMTVEALAGLLWLALATGLLFARFSRPTAQIVFSKNALIAPYRGITAFEFRIANERKNQIIELEAKVLFSRMEDTARGRRIRNFYKLNLERDNVVFFPLAWTVVHPIDEASPLRNLTPSDLAACDAEFLILLTGADETFSEPVHSRSSYKAAEIVWNARFSDIYHHPHDNEPLSIDFARIDEIIRL